MNPLMMMLHGRISFCCSFIDEHLTRNPKLLLLLKVRLAGHAQKVALIRNFKIDGFGRTKKSHLNLF